MREKKYTGLLNKLWEINTLAFQYIGETTLNMAAMSVKIHINLVWI